MNEKDKLTINQPIIKIIQGTSKKKIKFHLPTIR